MRGNCCNRQYFILVVTFWCRWVRQRWVMLKGSKQSNRHVFLFASWQVISCPSLWLSGFLLYYREQGFFFLLALSKNVFHQKIRVWLHSVIFFVRIVWPVSWEIHSLKLTFFAMTTIINAISVISFKCIYFTKILAKKRYW